MKSQVFSKWCVGAMAAVTLAARSSSAGAYIPEESFAPRVEVSASNADPEVSESNSVDNAAYWADGAHAVGVGCRTDAQLEPPPYTTYSTCAGGKDSAHAGIAIPQARIRIGSDAHGTGFTSSSAALQDRLTFNGPSASVPVTFTLHARGSFRAELTGESDENRTASAVLEASIQIGGVYTEPGNDDLGFVIQRSIAGHEYTYEENVTHVDAIHVRPLFDSNGMGDLYAGDLVYTTDGFVDDEDVTHENEKQAVIAMYPGAGGPLPPSMTVTLPTGASLPFVFSATSNAHCYTLGAHCVSEAEVARGIYAVISVPNGYTMTSELGATYAGEVEAPQPGAPGTLQLTQEKVIVKEDAGLVSFQVSRSGGATGAVSVRVVTEQLAAPGSAGAIAIAGEDFAALDTVIEFADGDTTAKTLTVFIIGDDKDETLEAFLVNLTSPTGGATLGSPASMTVSISNKKNSGCAAMGSEIAWMFLLLLLGLAVRRCSS